MKPAPFRHDPWPKGVGHASVKASRLTGKWTTMRRIWLLSHPRCARCSMVGEEVHHVEPRESAPHRKYDWSNLQTLCRSCHRAVHAQ
jgi:5-methylcytosine-specific restriction endonuclease McrA